MSNEAANTGIAGEVAIVTGAAGNIGRAVAVALAGAGADLILADLVSALPALETTAHECRSVREGTRCEITAFDIRDAAATQDAFAEACQVLGPARLVVNNAGYQGRFANVIDYDLDDAKEVFDINILGVFTVLQAAAAQLREAGLGGSIVNVASMAAHGAPNMAAYSASKAAVVGLTRAAALDLAPLSIRVNSVSPGFIGPGAMWDRQVAEQAQASSQYYGDDIATVAAQMIGQVPMRRFGSLDEVARVILFLLSESATYVTGSDLEIAGGV